MSQENRKPRGFEAFRNRQNKFVKALLFLPILPVFLVIGLPLIFLGLVLSLYAYAAMIIGAISLKIKMARTRRAISTKILGRQLAAGGESGTFICESYTLGWPVARIWWTPDAIAVDETAPTVLEGDARIEAAANPQQQWIYDTYANLKTGKALLLIAWAGKNTQTRLQRLFPSVPEISVWSAAIAMQRQIELRKQTQATGNKGTDPSTSSG